MDRKTKANLLDIARATGVSKMTVSRVLRGASGFSLIDREVLLDSPGFYAGYYGLETLLARQPKLDVVYFHNEEMAISGLAYATA